MHVTCEEKDSGSLFSLKWYLTQKT